MRQTIVSKAVALAVSLLLAACDGDHYSGDGTLTDAGLGAAHNRYVVDLGPVSLSSLNSHSFRLTGLPATEFTIGLRPINVLAGCDASGLNSTKIRLDVRTGDGQVVISEEEPLSAWVTSSDLVYRRGTEREEPKAGGAVKSVQTGVRASGGWGTYFTPRTSATYLATFEVLDAHGTSDCESRLVLLGGGWK
jgi:hypothetical protein